MIGRQLARGTGYDSDPGVEALIERAAARLYCQEQMEVHIRTSLFEELEAVMSILHDCPFDLDAAKFDQQSGRWTGLFLRPLREHPAVERRRSSRFFSRSFVPVGEVRVSLAGVTKVEVKDDAEIGQYTFNALTREATCIWFHFNEMLRIGLHVTGDIEATYDETPLPGVRAIFGHYPLGAQSGPRIEGTWPVQTP